MPLTLFFLGTPDFSVPTFQTLIDDPSFEILGALTQPDRPSGRGQKLLAPPVKVLAEQHSIPVYQPNRLRRDEDLMALMEAAKPDFLVTVAFGQILPQRVLDIPKYGTVNVHASLLPEYRGANPIQWAVLQGKTETGLTTMLTDIGVDTGEMLLKVSTPIEQNESAGELADRLSQMGGPLLIETLNGLAAGNLSSIPQPHEQATHAPKLSKEDALLDWSQDALSLHNKIRGQQPWPGAVSMVGDKRLKIIATTKSTEALPGQFPPGMVTAHHQTVLVQTGTTPLQLITVQAEGKGPVSAIDWWNGLRVSQLQLS